jgi:hypothetical protein
MDFVNFRQSDVPWSFGIWRLEFDSILYEFQEQAVEPHNAVRHKDHKDAVALVKSRQIAEFCPAIITCVSVLRLDRVYQNDIPCKYLWYIGMKTNFGNKEGGRIRLDLSTPWKRESMAKWKTSNKLSIVKYLVHIVLLPRDGAEM